MPALVLICGRFEGVDERVIAARGLEEVSIGDYVLSGGEIAAMALIDACVRLLPGVMGAAGLERRGKLRRRAAGISALYPAATLGGAAIPDVLLSGDHGKIAAWRRAEAERLTRERRPGPVGGVFTALPGAARIRDDEKVTNPAR